VLPFKASKLSVVQFGSANTIYTHNWSTEFEDVADNMISAVIESISMFAREVLHRGNIQQINLERLIVYIRYDFDNEVYYLLFTNRISRALKNNLTHFADLFSTRFAANLGKAQTPVIRLDIFEDAGKLIKIAFPYVPTHI